jgi:Fe2+ or Zn2+ uptake regulation protein
MNDIEISRDLRTHGIRPSLQRIQIYRFLDENRTHPTVDEIYRYIHGLFPVLSRMTVYNTVKLFAAQGIVTPVIIENKELRYDINTRFHGHFRCLQCGAVHDVFDLAEPKLPVDLNGFMVSQQHVYYLGYCKNCMDSAN